VINGGEVTKLDVRDLIQEGSEIALEHVLLVYPGFSPELAAQTNFRKARIPDDFIVLQELEAETFLAGTTKARESYADAIAVYSVLLGQFRDIGLRRVERRIEYLLRTAERKSQESTWRRLVGNIWDEQLRGRYGTSPLVVLRSTFWVWMLFSIAFLIMGGLRIAWGASILVTTLGNPVTNEHPRVIVRRAGFGFFQFLVACMTFSLDNLLFLGSRTSLGLATFSEELMKVPKRYVGIGIGRLVAGGEKLLGLVLLFNFFQAFLRAL